MELLQCWEPSCPWVWAGGLCGALCEGSRRPLPESVPTPPAECREKTKEALLELKAMLEAHPKMVAHYPVEVRFTRGDDILLSPCFQRDSCYMNIIMYR